MNKHLIIIGTVVLLLVVGLSGCTEQDSSYNGGASNNNDIYIPKYYTVVYEVTGIADSVSVTYTNSNGGTSQISTVYPPWERTLYMMESGDFVYISAQNNGDWGTVEVNIYVNGVKVKHSFSNGAYVIATANGILE